MCLSKGPILSTFPASIQLQCSPERKGAFSPLPLRRPLLLPPIAGFSESPIGMAWLSQCWKVGLGPETRKTELQIPNQP